MNRPLSECILVAFFRPAPYWDLPAQAMTDYCPGHDLKVLAQPGAISDQSPVYELAPKDSDEPALRFGINSMSINARGRAYSSWPGFLSHTLNTLEAMEQIYTKGEMYDPLILQYVDLFDWQDAKGLRVVSELFTGGLQSTTVNLNFEHKEEVDAVFTTLRTSYLFDDSLSPKRLAAVFTVEGSLPRIGKDRVFLETWLNSAHVLSKKLFWDALQDDSREMLNGLFSETEVSLFSGWTLGEELPELRSAYD